MIAVASLLVLLILSIIVTRVGAVALRLTGMSDDAARFQARSALTGSGFTTTESEQVVNHPVRRKIVGMLMVIGNIGLVAAGSTLLLSLIGIEQAADANRLAVLAIGLVALVVVARSTLIDRIMCGVITHLLSKATQIETRDFSTLLHLRGDYRIAELAIKADDWVAGRTIGELADQLHDVIVLGLVHPGSEYIGAPESHQMIQEGDQLVVYGLPNAVEELDCRCAVADQKPEE